MLTQLIKELPALWNLSPHKVIKLDGAHWIHHGMH